MKTVALEVKALEGDSFHKTPAGRTRRKRRYTAPNRRPRRTMRKTRLDLDALSVESFATTREESGTRGTVRGQLHTDACDTTPPPGEVDGCTCADSCLCPTNAYYCATAPATAVSCAYTYNQSCYYDTDAC